MNAQKEFLEHSHGYGDGIICAEVIVELGGTPLTFLKLRSQYTFEDYETFLQSLDFEYRNSTGRQGLFGTIWYKDGTWSERTWYGEWEYFSCPEIPSSLRGENGTQP